MQEIYEELKRVYDHFRDSYEITLSVFAKAVDKRSREDAGHTRRLTSLVTMLGREMGLTDPVVSEIRCGALLHDIGTLLIPESILLKTGSLTDGEWDVIRTHPTHSHELLSSVPALRSILDIPYCHHERWDGTGYPQRLSGEAIPLSARIFAVVDVYDALLSARCYRDPWPEDMARNHIRDLSGIHFDPDVVRQFLVLTGKN
ncbi:MAG: HD-GYP domain-containing protein [Nitrospirae bacterium]|nr:MAG: HD-GYP domain-containing protein [Nitrospirota bacterium]